MSKTNTTLALRYRPKTFKEFVSHDATVSTVKGMLKNRTIPNAILISGPSGVGKTTLARLIGRYLNCEKEKSCGKCQSCRDMELDASGSINHPDYIEINGSEGGNIDNIRELIFSAKYMPMNRFRLICVDEVHRLSYAASQALLKPLEEPPPSTLWILCTTDPDKIPNYRTIVGRCIVFNLSHPDHNEISEFIQNISEKEKFKWATKKTANLIASACNGQIRDAVQLLESLSNHIEGKSKPPKGKKELESIIGELSVKITTTEQDRIALKVLIGMYTGEPKSVQRALVECTDYVKMINSALRINYYLVSRTLVGKHESLWHNRLNMALINALKDKRIDVKDGGTPTQIHEILVSVKDKLFEFSTEGQHICTAMLTGYSYSE